MPVIMAARDYGRMVEREEAAGAGKFVYFASVVSNPPDSDPL